MTPAWLRAFVEPLESAGLRYAISGGVASSVFGEPRLTQDVDMLVAVAPAPSADVDALLRAYPTEHFYIPPPELVALESRRETGGHVNVIDEASGAKADLYFVGSDPLNALAIRKRVRRRLGDLDAWLVPIECLIVRKLEWYREGASARQLRDVRGLLQGPEPIDRELLDRLIHERSLDRWWREAVE